MRAKTVYILISFCSSFLFTVIFTVNMVYQVETVGLGPLQLVLVGTILELTAPEGARIAGPDRRAGARQRCYERGSFAVNRGTRC